MNNNNNDALSAEEAFTAMQFFLDQFYPNSGSGQDPKDIFTFIAFLDNANRPLDPAIWEDWLECIKRVKAGEEPIRMQLRPPDRP